MGPPDRKSQTFYRITGVPPPARPCRSAPGARPGCSSASRARLAGAPRGATPKRRRA